MNKKCHIAMSISFAILVLIFDPSTLFAQCEPDDLIHSNPNHPNSILCWPPNTTVRYTYYTTGEPIPSGNTADIAAAIWNSSNTCYSLSNSSSGGSIQWVTSGWTSLEHNPPADCLGLAITYYSGDNVYISSYKIYLNAEYYTSSDWTADCELGKYDVVTVLVHEFGHVLGLQDVSCSGTVMDGIESGECTVSIPSLDKQALQYICNNSAGRLIDFNAALQMNGTVYISWRIIPFNAERFWLERILPGQVEFTMLNGAVFPVNAFQNIVNYEFTDPDGTIDAVYRLRESNTSGHIVTHAVEKPSAGRIHDQPINAKIDRLNLSIELLQWVEKCRAQRNYGARSDGSAPDWVVIGPAEFISCSGISALAHCHEQRGLTTGTTSLEYIDSAWSGDIHGYIQHLYENGAQYAVLLGDANDHILWDDDDVWSVNGWHLVKPGYTSQPEYDIIPADYYLDQDHPDASMSYFTPYYASEFPKSDVDDDSCPEIVVGRIPARDTVDVLTYCAKAVKYIQNPDGPWVNEISLWIDCRHLAGNDGYYADSLGHDLLNYMPSGFNKHVLRNAPYPDTYSYAERESLAVAEFDGGRSLIVSFGTYANCYILNEWLDILRGFNTSRLAANDIFPFLLGISCEQGAFDETESAAGRPMCKRLFLMTREVS